MTIRQITKQHLMNGDSLLSTDRGSTRPETQSTKASPWNLAQDDLTQHEHCLLSTFCVPAIVLGVTEVAGSATKRGSVLPELTCQSGNQTMQNRAVRDVGKIREGQVLERWTIQSHGEVIKEAFLSDIFTEKCGRETSPVRLSGKEHSRHREEQGQRSWGREYLVSYRNSKEHEDQ